MTAYLSEILIAVTSAASVAGLSALVTWLIKSYTQFRKMADALESIPRLIEDHERRLERLEERA